MVRWIRARQVTALVTLVGALLIGGATAVLAAQNYASPGASHPQASASEATETAEPRATPESTSQPDQDHDQDDNPTGLGDQTLSGVIQSVSMEAHRFVLLPDGQQATVTIAFDTKTEINQEDGSSPLVAGTHVVVKIVKQADGTLSATEISGSQQGGDDSGEHGGQGQSTPTPGAGDHD